MVRAFQKNDAASRLLGLANIILLAALIYLIVKLVITVMNPNAARVSSDLPTANAQVNRAVTSQQYDYAFDPFHREAVNVPSLDIGISAPETTLNIQLFGLRAGADGSAILLTSNNEQKAFSVGDEIMPGVFLKSVQRGFITLSQNGKLERLTFIKSEGESGLLSNDARDEAEIATRITTTAPAASLSRNSLTKVSASDLLSAVSLAPHFVGDRPAGFKITVFKPGFNIEQFGLRDGDIISKIGSIDLTRGQPNISKVVAELGRTANPVLVVSRGGKKMTVKVGSSK